MGARIQKAEGEAPTEEELRQWFEEQGLTPRSWANEPGYRYEAHAHEYHKVLFCVRGNIVFHTDDGDFELEAGDRLDVEPGTEHAATVGSDGVQCIEAAT
jgi:quercetin dioxygenase-like cupin family protein